MEFICDSPRPTASTRHTASVFSPVTDLEHRWYMEDGCRARTSFGVLVSDAIH